MNNLHVCFSRIDDSKVMILNCWNCKKRRKMWGWFQEWYGWYVTCLGCGEQWADGEHIPRPFIPGWRKKNIEIAKKKMKEREER